MTDDTTNLKPPSFWILFVPWSIVGALLAFLSFYSMLGFAWQTFVFAGLVGAVIFSALLVFESNFIVRQPTSGSLAHFGCWASLFGTAVVAVASGGATYLLFLIVILSYRLH